MKTQTGPGSFFVCLFFLYSLYLCTTFLVLWWVPGVFHAQHCKPCYLVFPMLMRSAQIKSIKRKYLFTNVKNRLLSPGLWMYAIKFLEVKIRWLSDRLSERLKEESVRQIKRLTETNMTPAGTGRNSHSCISDTWKKVTNWNIFLLFSSK